MDKNTKTKSVLTKRDLILIGEVVDSKLIKFSRVMENMMDDKVESLAIMVSKSFDVTNKKIDSVHDELNTKIDSVHDKLDAKIDSVHNELNTKIDFVHADLSSQLAIHRAETREAISVLEPTGYIKNTLQPAR